jgi:hypothetical protein
LIRDAGCHGRARAGRSSPLPAAAGTAVEVDRLVNGNGLASLADRQFNVGYQLAGQKITLRMDGTQMAVIGHDGALLRTMPCPVPPAERGRLRGARRASAAPARPAGPVTVQRRVSCRGGIMVATQKIHVGMIHARKTATVTAQDDAFTVAVVPRTTTREVHRYKLYAAGKTPRACQRSTESAHRSFT